MLDRRKIQDINLPARAKETRRPSGETTSILSQRSKGGAGTKDGKVNLPERAIKKVPPKTYSKRRMHSGSPLVVGSREGNISSGGKTLWAVAFVLVLVLGYVVSLTLARASIRITLKEQVVDIDTPLALYENSVENQLDYDTVTFPVEASKNLDEVAMVDVTESASGEIVIYNNYSSASQPLREETRFEDPSGKIYKLAKGAGVTVPGQVVVNGEIIPGSIKVKVYAEKPGPEYNQGPVDFVIPGFRGGPKFEGFYARSVGAITGGFSGQRPESVSTVQEDLLLSLKQEIFSQSKNEVVYRIPEGYMVLPNTEEYIWKDIEFQPQAEGNLQALLKAEVVMLLVRKDEIENALLQKSGFGESSLAKLSIINLTELDYITTSSTAEIINLQVAGAANIRWEIDDLVVKRLVSGVKQRDFALVLQEREEVQSAEAEIKPVWIRQLPKKFEKIDIIYQNIDS